MSLISCVLATAIGSTKRVRPSNTASLAIKAVLCLTVLAGPAAVCAQSTAADDSTQILAVYAGGKVTVAQAKAKAKDMTGPGRALSTFESAERMYEGAARACAIRDILLKKASQAGLETMPGWKVAQKLIESRALASLMLDTTWFTVTPNEQEIEKFTKENPDMARFSAKSKDASAAPAATAFSAPSLHDWAAWQVRADYAAPLINALADEANSKHAINCAKQEEWPSGNDDTVLVRCGQLEITKKEIRDLSEVVGQPIDSCGQLCALANGNDILLSQGELARVNGYGSRPEFAASLRVEHDAWLASMAKARMLQELIASFAPSEAEIKDYYDKKYSGMQDQIVKCDAILCPIAVDVNASTDDRDAASDKARSLAASLIMKIQQGAGFDDLVKEHPECTYVEPSSRYVRPETASSVSASAVSGVAAGKVALQPVEENGGFCVVHVIENTPQQKMPLEAARSTVLEGLRAELTEKVAKDPEGAILDKQAFTMQKDTLAQLIAH